MENLKANRQLRQCEHVKISQIVRLKSIIGDMTISIIFSYFRNKKRSKNFVSNVSKENTIMFFFAISIMGKHSVASSSALDNQILLKKG